MRPVAETGTKSRFAENQCNMLSTFQRLKSILPYDGMISQTLFLRLLVYQACTRMIFLLFIITQSIFYPGTKHKRPMLNFTSQNQTFLQELCYHFFFNFFFYNENRSFILPFLIKLTKIFPSEFPFKNHLRHCLIMKN